MNISHERLEEKLPFYVTGALPLEEMDAVRAHLMECTQCRQEVALWQAVGEEIQRENVAVAPPGRILLRTRSRLSRTRTFQDALITWFDLIKTQTILVRSEIWAASLLVLVLGIAVAVLLKKVAFIYGLAPLVAAGGVALLYGSENDPAYEISLSMPISQVQLLLIRLFLVFAYNFLLVSMASFLASLLVGYGAVNAVLFSWLAPMAFLSSLAVLLSLVFGSQNSILATYLIWLARYLVTVPELERITAGFGQSYASFWQNPARMYASAGLILLISILLVKNRAGGLISGLKSIETNIQ